MFSKLRSSSSIENPQSSVEQFLDLQKVLSQAIAVADAFNEMEKASKSIDVEANLMQEYQSICIEKGKRAQLWVRAALSTDLASFTLSTKPISTRTSKKGTSKETLSTNDVFHDQSCRFTLVLERESGEEFLRSRNPSFQNKNNKTNDNAGSEAQSKPLNSARNSTQKISSKTENATAIGNRKLKDHSIAAQPSQQADKWITGCGLKDILDLAKQLQQESQNWFFGFFEAALDSGFHLSTGIETSHNQDNSQIVAMLSQLKRVNDWLDHLEEEEISANTLSGLKQKIYHFLIQNVELAATALGNQTRSIEA